MKTIFFLFIFAFHALFMSDAIACTTEGAKGGNCRGCRLDKIKKNESWLSYYNELRKNNISIVSCYRTQECQRRLVETCRRGQASRNISNHTAAIAMDMSADFASKATDLAKKHVKGHIAVLTNGCGHRGFHITNGHEGCASANYNGNGQNGQNRSSPEVEKYKEETQGSYRDTDGNYIYNGCRIQCRSGQSGGWYQRNSGQWIKMMLKCPL